VSKVDVVSDGRGGAHAVVRSDGRIHSSHAKRPPIVERVAGRSFQLDELGFWQVHHGAAGTLYRAVQEQTIGELFDPLAANLDLYGGVGLLAAAVGDRFGTDMRITSVESDPVATGNAAENLSDWAGATALTARVDSYLAKLQNDSSTAERSRLTRATVILDPPRSGAGKNIVASLMDLAVAQVIYIACDPVAFARDLAQFRAGGYELRSLRAFDLFPHTHHVETIAVLTP
jgi:tRNA/tmRNA/rRNA uracil-C5-methylase (TrmA/RlmC/RlmD family)